MARNAWRETLDEELQRWAGVIVEFDTSTNHNKATFYVGTQKRFVHMSRGSKARDAGRQLKNFRAEIRRTLKELGAQEAA